MRLPSSAYSLRTRMVLVLSFVLLLFLSLTGLALDRAYRSSVESGAAERLQIHVYLLLAALERENDEFYVLEAITEPRFSLIDSGLYGFVHNQAQQELWRSESARMLPQLEGQSAAVLPDVGEAVFDELTANNGASLFRFTYGIQWEGETAPYAVSVLETADPYFSQIRDFRASLGRWLGGAAALLLGVLLLLLAWGLRPLVRLAQQISLIEKGESDQVLGEFPEELAGVTHNLNRLIETERRQRERYKTTLADLAHSLKTPLSVATGALRVLSVRSVSSAQYNPPANELADIEQALQRMDKIVAYQLQRAVASRPNALVVERVEVKTAVAGLLNALAKVYAQRGIEVSNSVVPSLFFHGDERDLLEVLGNLLDNAFKHAATRISVRSVVQAGAGHQDQATLVIEDDGKGVAPEQRQFVLQRGARADTLAAGQGIGLAVVSDIVASYSGTIEIDASPTTSLGGARVTLILPQLVLTA